MFYPWILSKLSFFGDLKLIRTVEADASFCYLIILELCPLGKAKRNEDVDPGASLAPVGSSS